MFFRPLLGPVLRPTLGLVCAAGLVAGASKAVPAADRPAASPAPAASAPAQATPGNMVVARVDGTELHLSDVEAAQQSLPASVISMPSTSRSSSIG